MRISSTLSNAGGNFARPTKYNMILSLPGSLRSTFGNELDVLCKTSQLPAIMNEPYEIKLKGHPIKIPGRTTQTQEITVSFYVDDEFKIRKLFQDWIYAMDNRATVARNSQTESLLNQDDRYGEIELIGRDYYESTKKPIQWKFEKVYPTNIGELDFNTEDKDAISEISITFAYYRYNTDTPSSKESIENLDNDLNKIQ